MIKKADFVTNLISYLFFTVAHAIIRLYNYSCCIDAFLNRIYVREDWHDIKIENWDWFKMFFVWDNKENIRKEDLCWFFFE